MQNWLSNLTASLHSTFPGVFGDSQNRKRKAREDDCDSASPAKRPAHISRNNQFKSTEQNGGASCAEGNGLSDCRIDVPSDLNNAQRRREQLIRPHRLPGPRQRLSNSALPYSTVIDGVSASAVHYTPRNLRSRNHVQQHAKMSGKSQEQPDLAAAAGCRIDSLQSPSVDMYPIARDPTCDMIVTPGGWLRCAPQLGRASPPLHCITPYQSGMHRTSGDATGTATLPSSIRQRQATITRRRNTPSPRIKVCLGCSSAPGSFSGSRHIQTPQIKTCSDNVLQTRVVYLYVCFCRCGIALESTGL
jgi:hypothetical protein